MLQLLHMYIIPQSKFPYPLIDKQKLIPIIPILDFIVHHVRWLLEIINL